MFSFGRDNGIELAERGRKIVMLESEYTRIDMIQQHLLLPLPSCITENKGTLQPQIILVVGLPCCLSLLPEKEKETDFEGTKLTIGLIGVNINVEST